MKVSYRVAPHIHSRRYLLATDVIEWLGVQILRFQRTPETAHLMSSDTLK